MKDINFFKDSLVKLRKKARRLFLIKTWSLITLASYGLVISAVFSYHLLTNRGNQNLNEKIKQQEALIESLRSIESKQVYLTLKTKSLTQIINSQRKNQEIVKTILHLLPEGTAVDGFNIEEDGKVNLSGSCLNFKILKNFLANLYEKEDDSFLKVKEVKVRGISYGFENPYQFNTILQFYLGE